MRKWDNHMSVLTEEEKSARFDTLLLSVKHKLAELKTSDHTWSCAFGWNDGIFCLPVSSGREEQPESNMASLSNPPALSLWRRPGEIDKSKPLRLTNVECFWAATHTDSHINIFVSIKVTLWVFINEEHKGFYLSDVSKCMNWLVYLVLDWRYILFLISEANMSGRKQFPTVQDKWVTQCVSACLFSSYHHLLGETCVNRVDGELCKTLSQHSCRSDPVIEAFI